MMDTLCSWSEKGLCHYMHACTRTYEVDAFLMRLLFIDMCWYGTCARCVRNACCASFRLAPRGDPVCRHSSYLECVAKRRRTPKLLVTQHRGSKPTLASEADQADQFVSSIPKLVCMISETDFAPKRNLLKPKNWRNLFSTCSEIDLPKNAPTIEITNWIYVLGRPRTTMS